MTFINTVSRFIYKILGPGKSSQLAAGIYGKALLKIAYGNLDKKRIFNTNEGIKLSLTPNEAALLGLVYLGSINPIETEFIKKLLKPGDVFIDIGTYIDGWHSLVAAHKVGQSGQIISFEPHPEFFKRFLTNVELEKIKNLKAENFALSDKVGTILLYPAGNISSLYQKHLIDALGETKTKPLKVKTITLDKYLLENKIRKVDMIKIDVEGSEMDVLRGARHLLQKKNAPDLLVEVVDSYLKNAGASEKILLNYLKKLGYLVYTFHNEKLEVYKKAIDPRERGVNLFFTKKTNNKPQNTTKKFRS